MSAIQIFALPLLIALVYLIARSKRKGRTAALALCAVVVSFLLMLVTVSIFPALDTRLFGTVMGYVSLLVGALTALLCDR